MHQLKSIQLWYDSNGFSMKKQDVENWIGNNNAFPWGQSERTFFRKVKESRDFVLVPLLEKIKDNTTTAYKRKSLLEEEHNVMEQIESILDPFEDTTQLKILENILSNLDPLYQSRKRAFKCLHEFMNGISGKSGNEYERIKNTIHATCIDYDTKIREYRELLDVQMDYWKFL